MAAVKNEAQDVKPIIRLRFGERTFDVAHLMASEVAKIQSWTGLGSKKAWMSALGEDDINAWRAAYTLMLQRAGEEVRFSDADYDTDDVETLLVDPTTGREIEPKLELDKNGDPALDKDGKPQVVKVKGHAVWTFTDDGSQVPPTPGA